MRRTPRAILLGLVSALVAAGLTTTSVSERLGRRGTRRRGRSAATQAARAAGQPRINYAPASGSYFAYPNRARRRSWPSATGC